MDEQVAVTIVTETKPMRYALIYSVGFFLSALLYMTITSVLPDITGAAASESTVPETSQVLGEQIEVPQPLVPSEPVRGQGPALPRPKLTKPLDFSGISAKGFVVYDEHSGDVIAEQGGEVPVGIASVTKLMTALVAYQYGDLGDIVTISPGVDYVSPSLGLVPGDQVKLEDLLGAMIVGSANDAASEVATFISKKTGRPFVALMNEKAAELGMTETVFSNPNGFAGNNHSTAHDVRILVDTAENLSLLHNLGRRMTYTVPSLRGSYEVKTSNKLLKNHPEIEAIKTGYTEFTGGSMATRVDMGGQPVVVIVLASANREGDTLDLAAQVRANTVWE